MRVITRQSRLIAFAAILTVFASTAVLRPHRNAVYADGVHRSPGKGSDSRLARSQKSVSPAGADKALYDQYGAVIQDASGNRTSYTQDQMNAQRSQYEASHPSLPGSDTTTTAPASVPATWGYGTLGWSPGANGLASAQNGSNREIYSSGLGGAMWIALSYDSATKGFDEVYVSPYLTSTIERIKVANVLGGSGQQIVVALSNGQILIYDVATKNLLSTITTAANGLSAMTIADVDGDGSNELVICTSNETYVYSSDGTLKWDVQGAGGTDIIVAQMDSDPGMEIATTDGHVIDAATQTIQWTYPHGFGNRLAAVDVNGAGVSELIVEEYSFVWGYDVQNQLPRWSIPAFGITLVVANVDGSGPEILVGDQQWGNITAYDPATQLQKWTLTNPNWGVDNIVVTDIDGDGVNASSLPPERDRRDQVMSTSLIGARTRSNGKTLTSMVLFSVL